MMTNSRMTNLGWPPLTNFSNHRIISAEGQWCTGPMAPRTHPIIMETWNEKKEIDMVDNKITNPGTSMDINRTSSYEEADSWHLLSASEWKLKCMTV